LNSTVQVLRAIPELQTNLTSYTRAQDTSRNDTALTCSLRDTYQDLTKSSEGYSPFSLIGALRSYAPQFAQQTQGHYAQQDAEECWVQLLSAVRSTLDSSVGPDGKFVERYLTGELETESVCSLLFSLFFFFIYIYISHIIHHFPLFNIIELSVSKPQRNLPPSRKRSG
jgi:ubiquitin carboxyl-terminal hydrolase 14